MNADPLSHSIYCGLRTAVTPSRIAKSLVDLGWEGRMCSWTEHELTCDDAELVLVPQKPPLLSGGIRPGLASLHRVLTDLRAIGVDGDYELYNSENELVMQGLIHEADESWGSG